MARLYARFASRYVVSRRAIPLRVAWLFQLAQKFGSTHVDLYIGYPILGGWQLWPLPIIVWIGTATWFLR